MFHTITVKCEGSEHKFTGNDEFDTQSKAEAFLLKKAKAMSRDLEEFGEYIKLVILSKGGVSPEVKCYEHLDGTDITPKLLRTGSLFSFQMTYPSGLTLDSQYSYMAFEEFGRALDEIYGSSEECMNSSEDLLADSRLFDKIFPSETFPESIREKIRCLLEKLSDLSLEHQDIHAGNILMDEQETLKLIDFEYVEFL
ncbi:divergent serine/threonine protein kinase [Tokyovirus A1]|uniref:divergent serine/threonine protein kinase n=1 Tax=Tokyovirus A1 TaxID=1826170 RepID=UPI0007A9682E|nr:divergent serine/threonine protein kinase [Tokyovirus A1]BAU80266.1 divergent serine/threonine protein kinase [Tokyovirus A1]